MKPMSYSPRQGPKKRAPSPMGPEMSAVMSTYHDVHSGFGELKRQIGTAVSNVKSGIEKIKSSIKSRR